MSPEVRTVALDPLVNGLLAPVRRQELVELIDDLVVAGDAQLRAQLGEVGEDGVVGPGVVGILLPQHAAEAVAVGVQSLEHPGGHLRQCDELPDEGLSCRLPRNLFHRKQEGQREPGHAIHPDPAAGPDSQYSALMTQTPHS